MSVVATTTGLSTDQRRRLAAGGPTKRTVALRLRGTLSYPTDEEPMIPQRIWCLTRTDDAVIAHG
jgi:hypothetical protein